MTPAQLVEFVDDGGGIFLAADQSASTAVRGLAHDLGVDLAEPGARIEDRSSHAVGKIKGQALGPETLVTTRVREVLRALPGGAQAPLLYRGTSLSVAPDVEQRATVVVSAEDAARLVADDGREIETAQESLGLVAVANRPRGSGRAAVVGSLDALKDALFPPISVVRPDSEDDELVGPSNRNVFRTLAAWALGTSGTLRIASFETLAEAADLSTSSLPNQAVLHAGSRLRIVAALEEKRLVTSRPKPGVPGSVPHGPTWNAYVSNAVRLEIEGPETASVPFRLELETQGLPTGRLYARVAVPGTPGKYAWVVHHEREGFTSVRETFPFEVVATDEAHTEL